MLCQHNVVKVLKYTIRAFYTKHSMLSAHQESGACVYSCSGAPTGQLPTQVANGKLINCIGICLFHDYAAGH